MKTGGGEERIVRPALPLLLFPLGGCWAGLYGAQRFAWNDLATSFLAVIFFGLLLLTISLWVFRQNFPKKSALPCAVSVAILAGFCVGTAFWSLGEEKAQEVEARIQMEKDSVFRLSISEDPKQGPISQTSIAKLHVEGIGTIKVRILWKQNQQPAALGTQLEAKLRFKPLTDEQEFLYQRGIFGSVTLETVMNTGYGPAPLGWIYAFREQNQNLLATLPEKGSALLRGVLLGDTLALDGSEAGTAFKVTGLSHLVAVSGSHLVVIAVVVSWLIGRLKLKRSLEFGLVIGLLVTYVFLTGLQPSAIRSCIMAAVASFSPFMGRRGHIPSALAAAAVSMLMLYPPSAFSVGFWLSVFAVFGLTLFCPLLIGHIDCLMPIAPNSSHTNRGIRRTVSKGLIEPFGLTVTAQLATLPITAPLFATIPLISPLANLLAAPLVTMLVGAGIPLLCLMQFLGPVGLFLLKALCLLAGCANELALLCSRLPFACLPVALELTPCLIFFLILSGLIYWFWPQPSPKTLLTVGLSLACVVLLIFSSSLLPVRPQVVVLDVGQGDAILVREGSSTILIDTGSSNTLLLQALAQQRVSHLDALILTHLDDDHCGALLALSGVVDVDSVWFAQGLLQAQADNGAITNARLLLNGQSPQELAWGDYLRLGTTLRLTMLWPHNPAKQGGNEESICLALEYDEEADGLVETRMLLTGDAEAPELARILAADNNNNFALLKVGHHGSKDAVTVSQLEQMETQIACISVGKQNRYGHPTPETLAALDNAGVQVYRTDINGGIAVLFSADRLTIRCATIARDLS